MKKLVFVQSKRHSEGSDPEGNGNLSLSKDDLIIAKYGIDHKYSFAKVIGEHLFRHEVIVRYSDGSVRNLQYHEIIHDQNVVFKARSLPVVYPVYKSNFFYKAMALLHLIEIVCFVGLIIFGGRYADVTQSDDSTRNLAQFIAQLLGLLVCIKSLHSLIRVSVNPHDSLYWLISYKIVTVLFIDYYCLLDPSWVRWPLVLIGLASRLIQIYFVSRSKQFLNYSTELQEELQSHFYTGFMEHESELTKRKVPTDPTAHLKITTNLRKGRSTSFGASSVDIENNIPKTKFNDCVIHEKNFVRFKFFLFFGLSFMFFILPILLIDTFRILSTQNPLFDFDEIDSLMTSYNAQFNSTSVTDTNLKVIKGI